MKKHTRSKKQDQRIALKRERRIARQRERDKSRENTTTIGYITIGGSDSEPAFKSLN